MKQPDGHPLHFTYQRRTLMTYTWLNLVWLFFIYSLAGWIGEVCASVICRRKFVNRGFVNGPLCPIYGFAAVLFAIFLPDLTASPFFLFLGGTLIATVLEYFTGTFMEKVFHRKLWDYSNIRFNLGGYVCLRYSLIWGALSVVLMLFVNPFLCSVLGLLPHILSVILLWVLSILLFLDFLGTALAVLGMQKQAKRFAQVTEGMQQTSTLLENALTKRMQSRMMKSYPTISLDTLIQNRKAKTKTKPKVFAEGCSFYKLFCLFLIGAFLGDITETIFCYITTGTLMSRSSVVYGPFSIVWGLGCSMLTALLYRYKDKSDSFLFLAGTLLGGAYEYICSVFTELVFGTVFWDYSGFTFNLGGRINLLYCFFWGIAAVVWFKLVYPYLSRLIEKIPLKYGPIICNILIVFMIYNVAISSLALNRYTERNTPADFSKTVTVQENAQDTESTAEQNSSQAADSQEASSEEEASWIQALNAFLDKHFDDKRMARIYPNAKIVVDGVPQRIVNTN